MKHHRILAAACLFTVAIGVAIALLTLVPDGLGPLLQVVAAGDTDPSTGPSALFAFAIAGGVMAGWGRPCTFWFAGCAMDASMARRSALPSCLGCWSGSRSTAPSRWPPASPGTC